MIHIEEGRPAVVPPHDCDPAHRQVDFHPAFSRKPSTPAVATEGREDAASSTSPPPAPFPRIFPGL